MRSPSRPELFHPCPLNFDPHVQAGERIRPRITIADDTLREGRQASEVAFSPGEEMMLAVALENAGVPIIQVGFAGADDARVRRIRQTCRGLGIAVLVVGWSERAVDDLRSAHAAGADGCSILFRAADAHLTNLGHTRASALARVRELAGAARATGYRDVMVSPSFSTLADPAFLLELHEVGLEAGAGVITLADSTGTAKPAVIRHLVAQMRTLAGDDAGVRVHMHNDMGLALANTLAGIEAGADWADVTVSGLGERAGNCALEELVVALEALYGVRTPVRSEALFELGKLVERLTGVAIPPMKPVTGGDVFASKLELHVKALSGDPRLIEPYDPAAVGNRRSIRLGVGSGPTGVRHKLEELGLTLAPARIPDAVRGVNERALTTKRALTDDDFRQLVAELRARFSGGGRRAR